MDFGANEFKLAQKPKGSEQTNRQHFERIKKNTRRVVPELERSYRKPAVLYYLWEWFCDIYQGVPITYQELAAWSGMTGTKLHLFEIDLLKRLTNLANNV